VYLLIFTHILKKFTVQEAKSQYKSHPYIYIYVKFLALLGTPYIYIYMCVCVCDISRLSVKELTHVPYNCYCIYYNQTILCYCITKQRFNNILIILRNFNFNSLSFKELI
jgi:hypothetical protein